MDDTTKSSTGSWVAGIVSLVVLLVIIFSSFGTVLAGNVGVMTEFRRAKGTVQPGLYVKIPFVERVVIMDTQTQKEQVDANASSNDLQQVTATVAVNFHVNSWDALTIYQNVGADYKSRVIDPAIQESVKSITANYTAEQLITNRETVRVDILNLITQKMQPFGINVDALNIVNFAFSDQFNTAIENKVTAEQNALTAQNKLVQVQAEADQTVATAKAQAEAIQIQAQAINSQGGADYVQLQAVNKWNGVLPTQMIPSETLPFINANPAK